MNQFHLYYRSLKHSLHKLLRRPYKLHVKIYGSGPTVVLLHGINGNIDNWRFVIDELKKTHTVIAVDLLGFGNSQRPDNMDYSAKDHIKSIKYTLKKIGADRPFVMAGHSMGSILAVSYAAAYPKHVSRLVLCSLPYYNNTDIRGKIGARWSRVSDKMLLYVYRQLRKRPRITIRGAKMLKKKDKKFAFELTHSTWYPFHQSLVNTIENQRLSPKFKKLDVPIDLVYGKYDRLLNKQNLRQLAKTYPNVNLYRLPVSHDLTEVFSKNITTTIETGALSQTYTNQTDMPSG